jgi:hypothetical protein
MFVRIAFTPNQVEAGEIHSALESGGFHPAPIDYSAHISVAGAEQGYHVEVPRPEAPAACEFLRQEGFAPLLNTGRLPNQPQELPSRDQRNRES